MSGNIDWRRGNWQRHATTMTVEQRFWAKVNGDDYTACWLWMASLDPAGYGMFYVRRGFITRAHRWAYEHMVGPVPEGLELDHLCRNTSCCNPWHLDPVTPLVNNRRSPHCKGRRTHCPSGHPYDEENTYRYGGRRYCRACQRAAQVKFKARQRAARAAA